MECVEQDVGHRFSSGMLKAEAEKV